MTPLISVAAYRLPLHILVVVAAVGCVGQMSDLSTATDDAGNGVGGGSAAGSVGGGAAGGIATGGGTGGGTASGASGGGVNTSSGNTGGGNSNDAGTAVPTKVPVLFAHGHFGRIDISCDNGRSWKHTSWYLSGDDAVCGKVSTTVQCESPGCFQKEEDGTCTSVVCDCSHGYQIAKGQAGGPNAQVVNWGWGNISTWVVQNSRDGIHWKTQSILGVGSGAVSYGDGLFILHAWAPSYLSEDNGLNWTESPESLRNVPRQAIYSTVHKTHIVIANGTFYYTDDRGKTFKKPATNPPCAPSLETGSSAESTSGVAVIWDLDGNVCRSSDGGKSWQSTKIGPLQGHGVFNSKLNQFVTWGGGNRYSSADGATWTKTAMPKSIRLGVVAVAPNGDFVASNSDANATFTAYANQEFYTSPDGLNWTSIPTTNFVKSHPLSTMRSGFVEGDAVCNPNYKYIHELRRDIDNGTVKK